MSDGAIKMTKDEYEFRNELRTFMAEISTDMKYTKEAIVKLEKNGCSRASQHDALEARVDAISKSTSSEKWIERTVMATFAALSGLIGGNVGK